MAAKPKIDTDLRERFLVRELVEELQYETGVDLFDEMVDGLRMVTAGVLATGKTGKVALAFTIKSVRAHGKGKWIAGRVTTIATVEVKLPAKDAPVGYARQFYVLEDGTLSVKDPLQGELEMGEARP